MEQFSGKIRQQNISWC